MNNTLQAINDAVLDGEMAEVPGLVEQALAEGLAPEQILKEGMIEAMAEVGRMFEEGDCFVPEMLTSAHAMKAGMKVLRPRLVETGVKPVGKVVIGTVQRDLHDIGKNLVAMMLEGAGFTVIDLGVDVAPQTFVDAVRTEKPDLLGLSALLTTTLPNMKVTIDALSQAGVRESVRVIVGGAPVTAEFAREIQADGFALDASQAATLAKKLKSSMAA